jgi:uncharacterized protein
MKVILDTNIWVSGLLFGGKPRQIFKLAKNEKLEIIVSDTLIAELLRTLSKARFIDNLMRLQKEPNELILDVRELSFTGFEASIQAPKDLRDLDDLFILALALGIGAIAIVSGDSDLLLMTHVTQKEKRVCEVEIN